MVAFTLTELLIVISIIAILATITFGVVARARARSLEVKCSSNQRNILVALNLYCLDNQKVPWKISPSEGGSMDAMNQNTSAHFSTLGKLLDQPTILLCPADKQHDPATSFLTLSDRNISYFVGYDLKEHSAESLVTGDSSFFSDFNNDAICSVFPGAAASVFNYRARWTGRVHGDRGGVSFQDGSVHFLSSKQIWNQASISDPLNGDNHCRVPVNLDN